MFRCRQNVGARIGNAFGKVGERQGAILLQHPKEMERLSDIQGLLYLPFEDKLEPEASKSLAKGIEDTLGLIIPASKL